MGQLNSWLTDAEKALQSLDRAEKLELPRDIKRDVTILRFTYTFEALWKLLQHYLGEVEGIEERSPKGCLRKARELALLTDAQAETALAMVDDRNRIVHTYKEAQADEVFGRLAEYIAVMRILIQALNERMKSR